MRRFLLSLIPLCFLLPATAQMPGDTMRVQAFNFNSTTRDTVIQFPADENISYEKILLKYTMRCKDGRVSTAADRNRGCGEWDYSCNTYLVDSAKIETVRNLVRSHHITNFSATATSFPYRQTPVYDYYRGQQLDVRVLATVGDTQAVVGMGADPLTRPLRTASLAGKSQYLFTATELAAAGLSAGNIDALSLNVLADSGEARYLKIKLKPSPKIVLDGEVAADGFTEVYYKNTTLRANQPNRFSFHTPFAWDGISSVLVEMSFSNIDADSLTTASVAGDSTARVMGLSATDAPSLMLTNNGYLECDSYKGVGGAQNRTVEAWIKTSNGTNGEICSWGANATSQKWVFRLTNGLLRVEVAGGGTVSSTRVDDGEWHHVACVLDGNNLTGIRFYVDGVLDANSATGTTAINTSTGGNALPLRISRGVNNRYFDGLIDEVRIWDTHLPDSVINTWRRLKITPDHPHYANLQLYFPFNESGKAIRDQSVHGHDATLIGDEYRLSHTDGETLFKDFRLENERPLVTFYQGDYLIDTILTEVDRPVAKPLAHFVVERTIRSAPSDEVAPDTVQNGAPVRYWPVEERIFDEQTDTLIATNTLPADGTITLTDLPFFTRFPFYNELVSFVTPYGIGLDFGPEGESWYIDMSDYLPILTGNKRLLMTLGGQWQEDMDLEFLFIVGTPPRNVLQYEQLWQGTNRTGSARINQIVDDSRFPAVSLPIHADAKAVKLRSSITGHGAEGEFHQNGGLVRHNILLDEQLRYNWIVTQECADNPIYPQGGTWVYDRQGWCPGERTWLREQDLAPYASGGDTVAFDYVTSEPLNPSGDYRYHVAHQVVAYDAANFALDAAVANIVAPNNLAEFTRVGTICANPIVVIRNTGATPLRELTLTYWLNGSTSPQTYQWSGNLGFLEEEAVTIPAPKALWFDILAENNVFHVELSAPNQGTDEYAFNNKMHSRFDVPEVMPHEITVELRTNNNPSENSYELIDGQGNVIGSNRLTARNTTYRDSYSLVDNCYTFVMTDLGGDGIDWWANPSQGAGFVRLRGGSGALAKIFEPDFGSGFEFSFTTDFVLSREELAFLTSIKLFPNPAQDVCTLEAEGLLGAQLSLTNALGQAVPLPIDFRTNTTAQFDLRALTAGIYVLRIQQGELVTTRKLVVE